jgi:hypothetical protein
MKIDQGAGSLNLKMVFGHIALLLFQALVVYFNADAWLQVNKYTPNTFEKVNSVLYVSIALSDIFLCALICQLIDITKITSFFRA